MNTQIWTTALALSLASAASAQPGVGDTAPAIEISAPLNSGIKKFESLRGKVLLLDFFATT